MTLSRSSGQPWRLIVPAAALVVVVVAGVAVVASQAPAPPSGSGAPSAAASASAAPSAQATSSAAIACDPATLKQLEEAVSHEWAAQGATQGQLIALNEAMFTCYFGAQVAAGCDISALAALQLSIGQVEATGQMPPVTDQVTYYNLLKACAGHGTTVSTAAGPAPPPSGSPGTTDCAALWVDWALHGTPYLTTLDQLVAFYTALLKCYAGPSATITCDITALAQAQLDMRDTSFVTWELTRGVVAEPNLLACLGSNPALLAGLGGLAAGNGGAGAGNGAGGGSPAPSIGPSISPSASPSPSPAPSASGLTTPGGPYAVKQIETLGGEKISGFVCSTSRPFVVAAQQRVAWKFVFAPQSSAAGAVSYSYSIPSAGESHAATGNYTISAPERDGTLHVSFGVSDHVVFKGFDGNIPVRYKFDLVPSETTGCP